MSGFYDDEGDVSPAKTSVTLSQSSDWPQWLFLVKRRARNHDIWQYIDYTQAIEPVQPGKPSIPEASTILATATSISDLSIEQKAELSLRIE